jgi:carotenoid cleavage dioxygenase
VPDNAHAPMFEDDIALNADGMIARSTSTAARSTSTSGTSRPSATSPRSRPAARCSAATATRSPTIPRSRDGPHGLQHHPGLARRPPVHDQGRRAAATRSTRTRSRPAASGTTTARSSRRPSPRTRASIRSPASCSSSATRRAACAATDIAYGIADKDGNLVSEQWFTSPIWRRSTTS